MTSVPALSATVVLSVGIETPKPVAAPPPAVVAPAAIAVPVLLPLPPPEGEVIVPMRVSLPPSPTLPVQATAAVTESRPAIGLDGRRNARAVIDLSRAL